MKCEEFIDKLDCLSATDIPQDMEKHMAGCDECREYYSVISALTPGIYPETPGNIKTTVLRKIKCKETPKTVIKMRTKILRSAVSVAAAAVIVISLTLIGNPNQARAAERLIDKSLSIIGSVKSMVMKIDVRTERKENFSDIDIDAPMVEHTLTVIRGNQTKWRLDKGWRCIVFDGTNKYMWVPDNSLNLKGNEDSGFEEWFEILLDPEMTLLTEKVATQDKGVKYSIKESGNEIVMTAEVKARGDFTNPYLRNTSIEESDTRREIIFDKQTNLIKNLRIYIKNDSREILVVEIKNIEYNNVSINESRITAIPAGIEWRDIDAEGKNNGRFAGITPEEAAMIVFKAFENNSTELINEALSGYNSDIFDTYRGIKVIRLGKAFKSGVYPGVFVPYEIKLPDGIIKKHNIALRNDNPNKEWVVDGGI